MSYKFNPFTGTFDEILDIPKVTKQSSFFTVTQAGHNITELKPIFNNGSSWNLAMANSGISLATHVAVDVDGDNFVATKYGLVEKENHGLDVGEWYFVSDSVAGGITKDEPDLYSNPILFVLDQDTIIIDVQRPSKSGAGELNYKTVSEPITQVSHGFIVGQPICFKDGSFQLAKADDGETIGEGVVVSVIDQDSFIIGRAGRFDIGTHGLDVGDWYFTSNVSQGAVIKTEPVTGFYNPIFKVMTPKEIQIYIPLATEL